MLTSNAIEWHNVKVLCECVPVYGVKIHDYNLSMNVLVIVSNPLNLCNAKVRSVDMVQNVVYHSNAFHWNDDRLQENWNGLF